MGVSTDAILCYGINYGDKIDFPWNEVGKHYEDWYYEDVLGYKPPSEIYDESGEYINGVKPSQDKINEYYDHRRAFRKSHPMPFDVVTHCSDGYPERIIAVPGTVTTASRGYPETIVPSKLVEIENTCSWVEMLDFLKEHGVEVEQPQWILASYWG